MPRTRSRRTLTAVSAAALFVAAAPAVAAPGDGGSDPGDIYADLVVELRDEHGVPVLTQFDVEGVVTLCEQPVSSVEIPGLSPVTNGADQREVWLVPLMGELPPPTEPTEDEVEVCDPQPAYASYVSEADLERLNLTRAPDAVLERKLAELELRLAAADTISLDSAGRITTDIDGDVDELGLPIPPASIDASPDGAAMYYSLMTTGAIPGLATSPAEVEGFDAWMLAAGAVGTAASKEVPLDIDAIEYYNRVSSVVQDYAAGPDWTLDLLETVPPNGESFISYGDFSYDRSAVFTGCATWLDVPTLTWKVSSISELVEFDDLPPIATGGIVDDVAGFTQLADAVRASILWQNLLERLRKNDSMLDGLFAPLDIIFQHGTLAKRIFRATGASPSASDLVHVYGEIASCLRRGEPFVP